MHVVRALVGIHYFKVHQVADHAELVHDAVAAQHVAGLAGDRQRLAAVVALQHRRDFGSRAAFVLHPPEAQHRI